MIALNKRLDITMDHSIVSYIGSINSEGILGRKGEKKEEENNIWEIFSLILFSILLAWQHHIFHLERGRDLCRSAFEKVHEKIGQYVFIKTLYKPSTNVNHPSKN